MPLINILMGSSSGKNLENFPTNREKAEHHLNPF